MRTKSVSRCVAAALAALTLTLCGCVSYDLGDFEDEQDYYSSFGYVGLVAQSGEFGYYSVEDYFYNEKSVNDFAGDIVTADEYIYFALPVVNKSVLGSIALYAHAEKASSIEYKIFVTNGLPEKIQKYEDPDQEQEKDDEGNPKFDEDGNPIYKDIDYDDLPAESAVAEGSFILKAGKWDSFVVERWKKEDGSSSKTIEVQSGEIILIRFENNSGLGKKNGLEKVSFSLTNLLVRVEEKEDI